MNKKNARKTFTQTQQRWTKHCCLPRNTGTCRGSMARRRSSSITDLSTSHSPPPTLSGLGNVRRAVTSLGWRRGRASSILRKSQSLQPSSRNPIPSYHVTIVILHRLGLPVLHTFSLHCIIGAGTVWRGCELEIFPMLRSASTDGVKVDGGERDNRYPVSQPRISETRGWCEETKTCSHSEAE